MADGPDRPWLDKDVFTTREAAEICSLSQQTIIRCFDSGRLRGFRVPGSRFRRIPRAELLSFMKAHGLPVDPLDGRVCRRVLLTDADERSAARLEQDLSRRGDVEVRTASTAFGVGLAVGQFLPQAILLDPAVPGLDVALVCRAALGQRPDTRIIVVADEAEARSWRELGAHAVLARPIDGARLTSSFAS